eukprot:465988_1
MTNLVENSISITLIEILPPCINRTSITASSDIKSKSQLKYDLVMIRFINVYSGMYSQNVFIPEVIIQIICADIDDDLDPMDPIEILETRGEFIGTGSGKYALSDGESQDWSTQAVSGAYNSAVNSTTEIIEKLQNVWYITHDPSIIFSSTLEVKTSTGFVLMGGVLTQNYFYFVSPVNYQTWEQFKVMSKIDELVDERTKIDEQISTELVRNLDIAGNEYIMLKMIPQLTENTRFGINQDLLFNEDGIDSLFRLFGLPYPNTDSNTFSGTLTWAIHCAINVSRMKSKTKIYEHYKWKLYPMDDLDDIITKSDVSFVLTGTTGNIECKVKTNNELQQWVQHLSKAKLILGKQTKMTNW